MRRQDWRPTAGASLCALHFAEDCFLQAAGKRSLTPDAVPTIFTHSSTLAKTTVRFSDLHCCIGVECTGVQRHEEWQYGRCLEMRM